MANHEANQGMGSNPGSEVFNTATNDGPEDVEHVARLGDIESSSQDRTQRSLEIGRAVLEQNKRKRIALFANKDEVAVSSSGD